MINETKENEYEKNVNYLDNNNNDSIDDDLHLSGKYIAFNSNTNRLGMVNTKVNIAKINTKISLNNDEDLDSINNYNINDNKANKLDNNIPFQNNSQKKSRNENNEEKSNNLNSVISFSNNNVITSCEDYKNNGIKKINLSENKNIKNEETSNIQVTGRSLNSIDRQSNKKLKPITLNKNKKKKKILVLEEKSKYKTSKNNLNIAEEKEEKKDEEKIIRKDRNGVPICKKNKKKVKITFLTPFENVTPIESYKKYNVLLGMPRDENFMNNKFGECQCCILV